MENAFGLSGGIQKDALKLRPSYCFWHIYNTSIHVERNEIN